MCHKNRGGAFFTKWRVVSFLVLTFIGGTLYTQNLQAQSKQQINNRIRLAQDYERRGNYEGALRIYRSLYDLVPGNQLYYEGVKRNMLRLKLYDALIRIINTQWERTGDLRLKADLGNVYYKSGAQSKALQLWSSMLSEHSNNRIVYPYVANAMLDNRLYNEAIKVYKLARKNFKKEGLFVFELANIYIARLNYPEATLEYLKYLENNPKQFTYIENRISSYTKDPDHAHQVARVLQAYLSKSKQQFYIRKLLANLYLRIEEFGNSLEEFEILESLKEPLDGKNRIPGQEIFKFAEQALRAGQYKYARQAFVLILSKYNKSPYKIRAQYGLALTSQKQGLFSEALASYDELIKSAPGSPWAQEAMFQIGEIYFEDFFEVDKALEYYQNLLRKFRKNIKTIYTYFRIGDCYAAKGQYAEAQIWYKRPLNENVTNQVIQEKAYYKSAYMDFVNGDFDSALDKLQKITEHLGTKQATEESYVNDALELTFLIEQNKNSSAEALFAYAEAQGLKLQRKFPEAILKLKSILINYPTAGLLDVSMLELGEIENKRGNFATAIEYFKGLLKEYPESVYNALAQKRIGEIYEQGLGNLQRAQEAYELALINYPNSLYLEEIRQRLRDLENRKLSN
jgi:tetratricopeptide (TPR) repeat protein